MTKFKFAFSLIKILKIVHTQVLGLQFRNLFGFIRPSIVIYLASQFDCGDNRTSHKNPSEIRKSKSDSEAQAVNEHAKMSEGSRIKTGSAEQLGPFPVWRKFWSENPPKASKQVPTSVSYYVLSYFVRSNEANDQLKWKVTSDFLIQWQKWFFRYHIYIYRENGSAYLIVRKLYLSKVQRISPFLLRINFYQQAIKSKIEQISFDSQIF